MTKWVLEGEIKGQETITKGFEKTPETFSKCWEDLVIIRVEM